ncbi:MAG TPA: hypothetical protein VF747_12190 [Blastocatellia bacterium]
MPAESKKDPAKMSTIDGRELMMLFTGLVLPPFAFLLNLQIGYTLVPWACSTGNEFVLHIISIATMAVAASGGLIAWREWQRGGRKLPDDEAGRAPRSRFISVLGISMSVLFSLIILAQWIPSFFLSPCQK